MPGKISDNKAGLVTLQSAMSGRYQIRVGILDKSKPHKSKSKKGSGLTISQVAEIHEYGLGVPERSWCRAWFDAEQSNIKQLAVDRALWCLRNNQPLLVGIEQVAVKASASCQNRIVSGYEYAENAPSTIARKKSSKPLIETGVFRSSIVGAAKRL